VAPSQSAALFLQELCRLPGRQTSHGLHFFSEASKESVHLSPETSASALSQRVQLVCIVVMEREPVLFNDSGLWVFPIARLAKQ
jgi:hypothetical protein